ncbi:Pol polyprotein [Elysia marginata]|uniref:Pol polyprotein n=1 Tax=Elysia marginata TaxID=1093978 RepID=A0AAV4EFK0_9GAST|nr:Pol polyprotein [Elysia marginata]
MPLGISSGTEIFHREMCHLLAGIPGTICNNDDILMSGRTKHEHVERLETVLERLRQSGITLNEKCTFAVPKDYPFQKVGMDLFEWKGQQYLLIVDYFSGWIELALLKRTSLHSTIEHRKSIFSRYSIPELVISNNGPQLASCECEFSRFSEIYGFEHRTSSPRHPQGNGEAKRGVQTMKIFLKQVTRSLCCYAEL